MTLTHAALAPVSHPIWLDMAGAQARAVLALESRGLTMKDILTMTPFTRHGGPPASAGSTT